MAVSAGESTFEWPGGFSAAISLAYEPCGPEAYRIQRQLDGIGVRGTFFLAPTDLLDNPLAWRDAVARGHEVGNADLVGMTDEGRLPNWTRRMIQDDLVMSEELFAEWAPTSVGRVAALPGRFLECADGEYGDLLESHFAFLRSTQRGVNHPVFCRPKALLHLPVGEALVADTMTELERAVELGAWTILSFDLKSEGVGDVHATMMESLPSAFDRVLWAPIGTIANQVANFHARFSVR